MMQCIGMRLARRGRFMFTYTLLCISACAHAQTLNMYDAVNKTITNYPLLQQRTVEVASSRAHIISVNDNRLPSLLLQDQLTGGTNNAVTGSCFPLGIIPSASGGINAADNGTVSDKYTLTEIIISLYLDWLQKYRLLCIEYKNVLRAETILNAIRPTVNSELKPGVDSVHDIQI
jgi:hypothetical protein